MDNYKQRIVQYIEEIEQSINRTLQEKTALQNKVTQLTQDNIKLQDTVRIAMSDIDNYVKELEEIRKQHVSSNNRN